jgi:hypothetical protein
MENMSRHHEIINSKRKKNCLVALVVTIIVVLGVSGYIFVKTKIWFHEFAQSARQAAVQGKDSAD